MDVRGIIHQTEKNAIFVFVFDVPIETTSKLKTGTTSRPGTTVRTSPEVLFVAGS